MGMGLFWLLLSSFRRRPPNLVIPAKAGIQLFAFALDLRRFANPASRPCALPRASLRTGHFLLLAQEKVTKEKGTPGAAVFGHPALRLRERAAEVR